MATDSIHVSALIPAAPQAVYDAWLSSEGHAKMTGAAATIEPHVGGKHSAWDGYISGETLELEPGKRIVQTWRASDFPDGAAHSNLVVKFEEEDGHTRLVVDHTDLPAGTGERFADGWQKFYVMPMLAHFGNGVAEAKPVKKAPARKPAKKGAAKKGAAKKGAAKKGAAKKTAAKKPAAKKGTAKKGAAKKTAKKAAAKKPAAKKPAAKKAAKKPAKKAAKKPAARKPKAAAAAAPPAPTAE